MGSSWFKWLEDIWLASASDARCMEIKVADEESETVMAPPFRVGPALTNGIIPAIGLGVYKTPPGSDTYEAVLSAIRAGYRHVDTAQFYGNERDVGRAIAASGAPRDQIFCTTKLWLDHWGYGPATTAVKASLAALNTGYIDLFLLHAPGDPATRAETWRALEECREKGLIRDIGVSNFSVAHLEKLAQTATVPPAVNQIEVHPWLQRRDLVKHCQAAGIIVEAYSPLAKSAKLNDPVVVGVAHHYAGATPAQVLIAWSLAKGMVTLPKSVHSDRQRENLAGAKLRLSEDDIKALDGLEEGLVTGWDPVKDSPV